MIVVDLSDTRLAKAKELGADITINARETDAVQEILALTDATQLGVVEAVDGKIDAVYDLSLIHI